MVLQVAAMVATEHMDLMVGMDRTAPMVARMLCFVAGRHDVFPEETRVKYCTRGLAQGHA